MILYFRALGGFSLRNCYCYSMIAIILAAIFVGAIIAATSVLGTLFLEIFITNFIYSSIIY